MIAFYILDFRLKNFYRITATIAFSATVWTILSSKNGTRMIRIFF